MVKEILQEIDVEKLTDEDVDAMILETDVDVERVGVRCRNRQAWCSTRRRLHRHSGGGTAQDQEGRKVHGGW